MFCNVDVEKISSSAWLAAKLHEIYKKNWLVLKVQVFTFQWQAAVVLPIGKTIIKVGFVSAGLQVTDFTQSVYDAPGWADSHRQHQTSAP